MEILMKQCIQGTRERKHSTFYRGPEQDKRIATVVNATNELKQTALNKCSPIIMYLLRVQRFQWQAQRVNKM